MVRNILLATSLFVLLSHAPALSVNSFEGRFNDFKGTVESTFLQNLNSKAQARVISHSYMSNFSLERNDVQLLTPDRAPQYFDVVFTSFFYTHEIGYVKMMAKTLKILISSGQVQEQHYHKMYGAYITMRMFDQARSFAKKFFIGPDQTPIIVPNFAGQGPQVWAVDENSDKLTSTDFILPSGVSVVVLTNTQCHFSQDFFKYLATDAKFSKLLSGKTFYLIPPEDKLNLESIRAWNKSEQSHPMSLIDRRSDWPEFNTWATPVFNFYWGGRYINSIVGWPSTGNSAAITKNIENITRANSSNQAFP